MNFIKRLIGTTSKAPTIRPEELAYVLFNDYIYNEEDSVRFVLKDEWKEYDLFLTYIVLYKIAISLLVLLAKEHSLTKCQHVRVCMENTIYKDPSNPKYFIAIKTAMKNSSELLDPSNHILGSFDDQYQKLSWTMDCLQNVGILDKKQAIRHNRASVIAMGWAMAWLKEVGIIETNPVTLANFASRWMGSYEVVHKTINQFSPSLG